MTPHADPWIMQIALLPRRWVWADDPRNDAAAAARAARADARRRIAAQQNATLQRQIIAQLRKYPGSSIADLIERMGYSSAHLHTTLARLHADGLVSFTTHKFGRKSWFAGAKGQS